MFIRTKSRNSGSTNYVQIVESRKEGKRVRQTVLKHVGIAKDENELKTLHKIALVELERLLQAKQGGLLFDARDVLVEQVDFEENKNKINVKDMVVEKTIVEGPEVVYGQIFDQLGFSEVLDKRSGDVLRSVVSERIGNPESKLSLAERISETKDTALSPDRIYRMMDKLSGQTEKVRELVRKNAERHQGGQIDVVFYDCTTLYFESTKDDEIRKFGFSKDHKFNQTQVVLAVATTGRGLPVDFQVFSGNTAEASTLIQCLERWKNTFPVGKVTFVADRGLFSIKNLFEIKEAGYDFIVACPLKKLDTKTRDEILKYFSKQDAKTSQSKNTKSLQQQLTLTQRHKDPATGTYIDRSVSGILSVDYSKSRADKDAADRERLIQKIRSKVGDGPSNPKELISNSGYKKFVNVQKTGKIEINEDKILADENWDGIHGVFSSLNLSPEEIRARYQHLWTIEETFRIAKSNLEIRPIFHWKKSRIIAHVAICYLSLAILRHIEISLRNKGIEMSLRRINSAVNKIQACVVCDQVTQNKFHLPVQLNDDARVLLETLRISYQTSVSAI